jgi:DNA polymerase
VLPTVGENNIVIVGEAPGRNEDEDGEPLIGDAGNVLWDSLGIDRSKFHVTNVNKCWPSITRTPKVKHVKACSRFLDEELNAVRPFLILAMGNTCMKFFKNQESGIMKQVENDPTEWSNRYNCWICWTMHPASVLYNPENRELYDKGIANFKDKIEKLG